MNNKIEEFLLGLTFCLFFLLLGGQSSQAQSLPAYEAKVLNSKKMGIYQKLTKKGPRVRKSWTRSFRFGAVQSKLERRIKGHRYWYVLIDGHRAGWVNQTAFARNRISLARSVSLVNNPYYSFPSRDAINYVTNSVGTVIPNNRVHVSREYLYSGRAGSYPVTFTYGRAKAKLVIRVRPDLQEGVTTAKRRPQPGLTEKTWKKHFRSSGNWGHSFAPERRAHTLRSGIFHLHTDFYQPATLSTGRQKLVAVGPVPEGLAVSGPRAYFSMFEHPYYEHGRIVSYQMNRVPNKYVLQKLPWLKWNSFVRIARHIKVSPLLKLGHGQAFSATKDYLYAIANDHLLRQNASSEEIMQIDKKDLQVKRIWTFKIWDRSSTEARYVHNAVFVNDHEFYAEYHASRQKRFEYWCVRRQGNSWLPQEVGATKGNFMSNDAPVQGFAYDDHHHQFCLAFNDYLFRIAYRGRVLAYGHFHTGREFEGIAFNGHYFYAELAQRPELLRQFLRNLR